MDIISHKSKPNIARGTRDGRPRTTSLHSISARGQREIRNCPVGILTQRIILCILFGLGVPAQARGNRLSLPYLDVRRSMGTVNTEWITKHAEPSPCARASIRYVHVWTKGGLLFTTTDGHDHIECIKWWALLDCSLDCIFMTRLNSVVLRKHTLDWECCLEQVVFIFPFHFLLPIMILLFDVSFCKKKNTKYLQRFWNSGKQSSEFWH